jgi:hypothetical protein
MLNGTSFGALLFVGAVDARTFLALADKKDAAVSATIFRHFLPIWWPNGRDMMLPLGVIALLANVKAYFHPKTKSTKHYWLVPTATHGLILGWTGLVMSESIRKLLEGKEGEVSSVVRTFCYLHMPRILFAGVGMVFSTLALANDVPNSQ